MSSSVLLRSPALVSPIAVEHVTRLLHTMDLDLDELITLDDLRRFIAVANLDFPEEEIVGMFHEANYKRNGTIDVEQLGKAVSGLHPYREYAESWRRLFESAPCAPEVVRMTALPAEVVQRQPIQASFEQERELLTFSPKRISRSGLLNGTPSRSLGLGSRTFSFSRLDLPPSPSRCSPFPREVSTVPSARFSFSEQAAFNADVDALDRASAAFDWRTKLTQPSYSEAGENYPPDWRIIPASEHLSVREDGVCTRRGAFTAPYRRLITEGDGTATNRGNFSANTKAAQGLDLLTAQQRKAFKHKALTFIQDEKTVVALQRLAAGGKFEEPPVATIACGKPRHAGAPASYSFRPGHVPRADAPQWETNLGAHWIKKEARPISALYDMAPASGSYSGNASGYASGHHATGLFLGVPSTRLAATENLQPSSRLHWLHSHGR